ncbi:hypothetical protein H6F93_19755 [Leptolyngbya sp. FACHB-671]|nr:hypothetical protein [Leptolyngbya sp. FACHB-671]MBD2069719.1 hypothetical protein [Leptolyngbya sp. FACHB-671]
MNQRFPAKDIPSHAREMLIEVRQRVIVDAIASPGTLECSCYNIGKKF